MHAAAPGNPFGVVRECSLALPGGLGVSSWLSTIQDHVRTGIICCGLIGAVRCVAAIGNANASQNIGTKLHVLRRKKKTWGLCTMNRRNAACGIPELRETHNVGLISVRAGSLVLRVYRGHTFACNPSISEATFATSYWSTRNWMVRSNSCVFPGPRCCSRPCASSSFRGCG